MSGDNVITFLLACALVVFLGLRMMVKTTCPRRVARDAVRKMLASNIVKWLS